MINKQTQSNDVLHNIKKSMEDAECQRKAIRLQHNIRDFLSGNVAILKNNEFVSGLISYFTDIHPDLGEEKDKIIKGLGSAAVFEDSQIRERAHMVLSSAVQFFISCDAKEKIFLCQDMICSWLLNEKEMLSSYPVMNKRLEELFAWMFAAPYLEKAEAIATVLRKAKDAKLEKGKALQSVIGKTLDNLAKKKTLEQATDGYLTGDAQQNCYRNILIAFGEKAVTYLLNRLIQSYSRKERLALLDLIPAFQENVIAPIEDCIKKKPPWIIIRNLIYIVGEIGQGQYFKLIAEFSGHSDERVQHEIISTILKLGGIHEKDRLLMALDSVNDNLKIYVIRLLLKQSYHSEDVLAALCSLAKTRHGFSAHSGFDLLMVIVTALKEFPSRESIEILTEMEADYQKIAGSEEIVLKIQEALNVIEPQVRHSHRRSGTFDEVSFDSDPILHQQILEKTRMIENEIRELMGKGKVDQAGRMVYDRAVEAARRKDFGVAEMLRDRLLEVNPMAMAEVIELGEMIEDEKNNSITSHHLAIWQELYEDMSIEEFNTLYYALRTENYEQGDVLVKSGEMDSSLYFLNSGYLSLSCVAAGNDIFLKRMQPSDILGSGQFFAASVWTVTLKAMSDVQVQVLEYPDWLEVIQKHPELEENFQKYCRKYENVPKLLKMAGDDRREYPRYRVNLITRNILLDPYGSKGRELKGELIDISEGGLAFIIRIANRKNAKLLLGRHIATSVIVENNEILKCSGAIVAVRLHDGPDNDYSIHVKLTRRLERSSFHQLLSFVH